MKLLKLSVVRPVTVTRPRDGDPALDWSFCPAVERDPDRVSGAWVFRGTRVPVKALFENLESGARIDDFLSWFPGVSREMAVAVLEHAQRSLQTEAR